MIWTLQLQQNKSEMKRPIIDHREKIQNLHLGITESAQLSVPENQIDLFSCFECKNIIQTLILVINLTHRQRSEQPQSHKWHR